jgi:hypothetical protein
VKVVKLLAGATVCAAFFFGIGRAIDHEVKTEQRVMIVKHGVFLDCRIDHKNGSVYLNDCNRFKP